MKMQDDLIRRSAVIDIIHKEIERTLSFAEHETQINIEMAVEELPCAYDVEKVIAELEEHSRTMMPVIPTKEAIEIVRNGGKE